MNRRTAEESKESIIEAAVKVFSEKGYSQTTIREVAREAGISVGGVYIYFKNKECNVKTAAMVIIGILRGFVFSLLIDSTALYSSGDCSNIILNGLLRRKE